MDLHRPWFDAADSRADLELTATVRAWIAGLRAEGDFSDQQRGG